MNWLWNRCTAVWVGGWYLVYCLQGIAVWAMIPATRREVQEMGLPFLLYFHAGYLATVIGLPVVFFGIKALSRAMAHTDTPPAHQLSNALFEPLRHRKMLKLKELYDAGIYTETEYREKLHAIKNFE